MSATKLLHCPLCNEEVILEEIPPHKHMIVDLPDYNGGAIIECKCGCSIMRDTKEEAIQAWNSRKPIEQRIVKLLEEIENHKKERDHMPEWLNCMEYAIEVLRDLS